MCKSFNKIENKKIRKILHSDFANMLVDIGAECGQQKSENIFLIKNISLCL